MILILSVLLQNVFAGYPLTCVFDGEQSINIKLVPPSNGPQVSFGFRPATNPATAGVDPGTCAWDDRGMRDGEPTTLVSKAVTTAGLLLTPVNGVMQTTVSGMPWIIPAAKRGYSVRFMVNAAPAGTAFGIATPIFLTE